MAWLPGTGYRRDFKFVPRGSARFPSVTAITERYRPPWHRQLENNTGGWPHDGTRDPRAIAACDCGRQCGLDLDRHRHLLTATRMVRCARTAPIAFPSRIGAIEDLPRGRALWHVRIGKPLGDDALRSIPATSSNNRRPLPVTPVQHWSPGNPSDYGASSAGSGRTPPGHRDVLRSRGSHRAMCRARP
jgi:hypothetical protein